MVRDGSFPPIRIRDVRKELIKKTDYPVEFKAPDWVPKLPETDEAFGRKIAAVTRLAWWGIDFTARDLQRAFREKGHPWELSKAFDNSAAIGEFISLEQAGGDIQNIDFHLDIDGKQVQQGCTKDMLFKVDEIIAYVSQFMTLKIGDLLFTGTPVGVGPVSIGQHLQGYIGEEKLLDFYIR